MKTNKTIEQLFKEEQSHVVVPSREAFQTLIANVTKPLPDRNTYQKGILSPFGIFIRMSKNKLILAGSVALLAIIVIIPNVYHGQNKPVQIPSVQTVDSEDITTTQAVVSINQSAQGTPVEDIAADIVADLNQENILIQQEFNSEIIITDDSTLFDDITI